jgi:hypothetical protein
MLEATLTWYARGFGGGRLPLPANELDQRNDCGQVMDAGSWSVASVQCFSSPRRAEYKPYELRWEHQQNDVDKGKLFILPGTDNAGRPVIIMRPRCVAG